jgi:hypothetical protein
VSGAGKPIESNENRESLSHSSFHLTAQIGEHVKTKVMKMLSLLYGLVRPRLKVKKSAE